MAVDGPNTTFRLMELGQDILQQNKPNPFVLMDIRLMIL